MGGQKTFAKLCREVNCSCTRTFVVVAIAGAESILNRSAALFVARRVSECQPSDRVETDEIQTDYSGHLG